MARPHAQRDCHVWVEPLRARRACAGGLLQPSRVGRELLAAFGGSHVWAVTTFPTQAERDARRPGWPARAHGWATAGRLPVKVTRRSCLVWDRDDRRVVYSNFSVESRTCSTHHVLHQDKLQQMLPSIARPFFWFCSAIYTGRGTWTESH